MVRFESEGSIPSVWEVRLVFSKVELENPIMVRYFFWRSQKIMANNLIFEVVPSNIGP